MSHKLSQPQRLIVAIVYLLIIGTSFSLLGGNLSRILDSGYDESIWFYSGVLLIVMGQYVTEPFFSTPADSLANSLTLAFALLTVEYREKLVGYYILFGFAALMFVISIIAILLKDKNHKFAKLIYVIVKNLGSSKFIYSIVFLLSSYSYFANNQDMPLFIISIAIWICIVFLGLIERIISFFVELKNNMFSRKDCSFLGYAVKCNNTNLYTIQLEEATKYSIPYQNHNVVLIKTDKDNYSFGLILRSKLLLENVWIDISLICNNENKPISVQQSHLKNVVGIHLSDKMGTSRIINLQCMDPSIKDDIEKSKFYINFNNFIGYIEQGSNINIINFSVLKDGMTSIKEGSIISTYIYGEEVLYQVINGITKEERYDTNNYSGYICGVARKLGVYDYSTSQLNIVKWTPTMGEKVYLYLTKHDINLSTIAQTAIGRMPETDMQIPIADINSLVTHNTAILGILGVGKSCLTFELIKKITSHNVKVMCIDITNQYYSSKGLFGYLQQEQIVNDIANNELVASSKTTGASSRPAEWGNVEIYKARLKKELEDFFNSDKLVMILNPDSHPVSKPASLFNIAELVELSIVEKTRIISEALLGICMAKGQSDIARCCMVYEEAHSLVPEWNSVASSGDERAANGTARVILQGRKYGLGCLLITQRTANVTKSILNQCNTIFALRVFDDTGKAFLENYIGKDYSDTLPTLEERHAIAIGKALKLKQPVIIQLNDMKYLKQEQS